MPSTLRKHLAVTLGVATLLAAEVGTAVAQPAGPASVKQLRQDTKAIHALGISGVQARRIGPDGRQSVATSGTADLNTGRPVPSDGYFRMASTSKTLVATVVLQLDAADRLSLDDTVDHWLPGVVQGNGNDGNRITIRQLLQHTSGIRDDLPGYTTPEEYYQQRQRLRPRAAGCPRHGPHAGLPTRRGLGVLQHRLRPAQHDHPEGDRSGRSPGDRRPHPAPARTPRDPVDGNLAGTANT